ncbi:malate synthase [Vibrio sp. MACH09]|nr:malate synthase [Vibrio sp. MACH09]
MVTLQTKQANKSDQLLNMRFHAVLVQTFNGLNQEGDTMNMPANISTNSHNQRGSFIAEAVFAVESLKDQQAKEKQVKAKQLLDTLFPLDSDSHSNVTSYILNGRHLMAFFAKGKHCGLAKAGQFVAYTGHRDYPDSILLRGKDGSHIEVSFKQGSNQGNCKAVEISDIQLETCATFNHGSSEQPSETMRHWISLLKSDQNGQPRAKSDDKDFTAKNGENYLLTCWF